MFIVVSKVFDLVIFFKVMRGKDKDKWLIMVYEEFNFLIENDIWVLEDIRG